MSYWAATLILLSGIGLAGGDILLRKWVGTSNNWFYVLGFIVYFIGLNCLAQSFKYKGLVIAATISVIINILILLAASYFLFKEPLSVRHFIGIGLGIATIIFLW